MSESGKLNLPDLPGVSEGWELLTVSERKAAGTYTAASLERDQARRDLMIAALAEGRSVRTVANAYGVCTNLVLAVKRKFAGKIETEKERLGLDCLDVARLAVERMRDEMDKMPMASLPIIAGVMTDKGQLLTGAPTARVRVDHVDSVASVADYIAGLPAAVPVKAGEERREKAGDVIELAESGQAIAAVDEAAVGVGLNEGARDLKSLDSHTSPEEQASLMADSWRNDGENEGEKA